MFGFDSVSRRMRGRGRGEDGKSGPETIKIRIKFVLNRESGRLIVEIMKISAKIYDNFFARHPKKFFEDSLVFP